MPAKTTVPAPDPPHNPAALPATPAGAAAPPGPRIAVIVPAWQAIRTLPACLAALAAQDLPAAAWTLTVVDNGSTDGGRAWLAEEAAQARWGGRLTVVDEPRRGPSAARNRGAALRPAAATLVFLDADCVPRPDWLRRLTAALATGEGCELARWPMPAAAPADNAADKARPAPPDAVGGVLSAPSAASLNLVERFAEHHGILDVPRFFEPRPAKPPMVLTANFAVTRAAFDRLGGFDETLAVGEDADFCWRLLAAGGRLGLARAAAAEHRHRTGARAFARQMFRYGEGSVEVFVRHRDFIGRRTDIDWGTYARLAKALGKCVVFPFTQSDPLLRWEGPLELVRYGGFAAGRWRGSLRRGVVAL